METMGGGSLKGTVTCLDGRVNIVSNISAFVKPTAAGGSASVGEFEFMPGVCRASGSLGAAGCMSDICK
jgi:hypothetical protein